MLRQRRRLALQHLSPFRQKAQDRFWAIVAWGWWRCRSHAGGINPTPTPLAVLPTGDILDGDPRTYTKSPTMPGHYPNAQNHARPSRGLTLETAAGFVSLVPLLIFDRRLLSP
jgi:hypothetical protein